MSQLSNMLILATQRHDGQFDKGGKPYILHPMKVMHYLRTDDEELQCIALGHDVIEDTFNTVHDGLRYLLGRGFSNRVVDGILALTKREGQDYDTYKRQVVNGGPDAMRVKMADLRHNSDIRRLKGVTQKDVDRMIKYQQFYLELQALV